MPCGISISMEAEVVGKRTKLFWWKATLGLFLCMSHLFCGRFRLVDFDVVDDGLRVGKGRKKQRWWLLKADRSFSHLLPSPAATPTPTPTP